MRLGLSNGVIQSFAHPVQIRIEHADMDGGIARAAEARDHLHHETHEQVGELLLAQSDTDRDMGQGKSATGIIIEF
jgi:hypothetical protein